jgi:hypothetical protein
VGVLSIPYPIFQSICVINQLSTYFEQIMTDVEELQQHSTFNRQNLRKFGRLIAIKPVLIIYGLQWAITGPVTRYFRFARTFQGLHFVRLWTLTTFLQYYFIAFQSTMVGSCLLSKFGLQFNSLCEFDPPRIRPN